MKDKTYGKNSAGLMTAVARKALLCSTAFFAFFVLAISGAAFAEPPVCQDVKVKRSVKDKGGNCAAEEKKAEEALKGLSVSPRTKEYCETTGRTTRGWSNVLMLDCVKDMKKRETGGVRK